MNPNLNLNRITVASTLSNMMSISEYFIPPISTGIRCPMCGMRTSLQIWCSASDSQNSHASSETEESVSCVLISMYWIHLQKQLYIYYETRTSVHQKCKNKNKNKNDYSTHNAIIVKTMSARSSTGTAAKLYLTCNNSLITLILLNSGIMTLCWWTCQTNCLLILPIIL